MRDLAKSSDNMLEIYDPQSGSDVGFFYRPPTTKEHIGYHANLVKKEGNKIKMQHFETRVIYAKKILTGIRDGDFGLDGKPISSDPQSPDYREDWKDLVEETAADLLSAFATAVFEGARRSFRPEIVTEGEDVEPKEGGDDDLPLG